MNAQEKSDAPSLGRFKTVRRKAIDLSQESLVRTGSRGDATGSFPLVISPEVERLNLAAWAEGNREFIETHLLKHGAILFRGFDVATVEQFEDVARAVSIELLDYRERSSPRSEVSRGVYTSTDYPADQSIHFHNEQSYTQSWPMKLWFYCMTPAEEGGATPLADGRGVLQRLSADTIERFTQKRVMYVRNYGDGLGLSWQTAFQTTSAAEVESYCRRSEISFEWKDGGRLRTRQLFDNIARHPRTGEPVWFEHAAFFHISSLDAPVRDALLAEFSEEDLPFNTYYGDGAPLEPATLEEIREAYRQESRRFDWRPKDILLIDNMLTSHSREPFKGERKIVVAMAQLYDRRSGSFVASRARA
jgi:alpha-ketoglutarate-dependent taurine dioxygenase